MGWQGVKLLYNLGTGKYLSRCRYSPGQSRWPALPNSTGAGVVRLQVCLIRVAVIGEGSGEGSSISVLYETGKNGLLGSFWF